MGTNPKNLRKQSIKSLHRDSVYNYPDVEKVVSGNEHLDEDLELSDYSKPERTLSDRQKKWRIFLGKEYDWHEFTRMERALFLLGLILKIIGVFLGLYVFTVALTLMSIGLRLISGKAASSLFVDKSLLGNPIAGVMAGVFVTILLQSSSASTSIIVSMVASDILTVRTSIPIVMGANIGTSITNTAVALAHIRNKSEFRKAFAGATVHDCFNSLTTVTLLIVEQVTHYLERVTSRMVSGISEDTEDSFKDREHHKIEFFSKLTSPLVKTIVRLDKAVDHCWLTPVCAKTSNATSLLSSSGHYLFKNTLKDKWVGTILLVISIILIILALIAIVKLLASVLRAHFATITTKIASAQLYCPCAVGYLAILAGAVLTVLVQSSSVFTSSLIPLMGIGVIDMLLMYPLTLGSNVGTTTTAIIAAFASSSSTSHFKIGVQVALCHLLFNVTGILLFYPIPFMRWPLFIAVKIGDSAAQYRWFAFAYILVTFLVLPCILFGLSMIGLYYCLAFVIFLAVFIVTLIVLNVLEARQPTWLPKCCKDKPLLPVWLSSLEPYDRWLMSFSCLRKCCASEDMDASGVPSHLKASTVSLQSLNISETGSRAGAGAGDRHDQKRGGD